MGQNEGNQRAAGVNRAHHGDRRPAQSLEQEGETLKISLEKLLETILRMEEECEAEIGLKMKEIEKRIFGLQKGKKIGKGYGGFLKNRPIISRKV